MAKAKYAKYAKRFNHVKAQQIEVDEPIVSEELQSDGVIAEPVAETVAEPVIEPVVEEKPIEFVTDVAIVEKPVQKTVQQYNHNNSNNILNSILTTMLAQEYERLRLQLIEIKRQLDARRIPIEEQRAISSGVEDVIIG